jgi:hypothetical protein
MHAEKSPLAGKTVIIKKTSTHFQYPKWGGTEFHIEDWWDRVGGRSWMFCDGNPACLVFAVRSAENKLPTDNEVLYGHAENGFGSLIHISEIEETSL